jgi:hypothetical protein
MQGVKANFPKLIIHHLFEGYPPQIGVTCLAGELSILVEDYSTDELRG